MSPTTGIIKRIFYRPEPYIFTQPERVIDSKIGDDSERREPEGCIAREQCRSEKRCAIGHHSLENLRLLGPGERPIESRP